MRFGRSPPAIRVGEAKPSSYETNTFEPRTKYCVKDYKVIDEKQFDSIVANFYNAATGALDWNDALTPIHEAFKTKLTNLHFADVSTGKIVQYSHSNGSSLDPGIFDYVRYWHQLDPRRNLIIEQPQLALDRWFHCSDYFDDQFAQRDEFFQQFLVAHETRYSSITATMVTESVIVAFNNELPAARGPLNPDEVHVLDRLSRHIFEALRMHERVRRLAAQAVAGTQCWILLLIQCGYLMPMALFFMRTQLQRCYLLAATLQKQVAVDCAGVIRGSIANSASS
jgi:hypothetical protein